MNIWRHKHLLRNIILLFIGGIAIGLSSGLLINRKHGNTAREEFFSRRDTIVAAFTFRTTRADCQGYAAGFEFLLLKQFAEYERCNIYFRLTRNDTINLQRALRDGIVDILIADSAHCDFLLEDRQFKFTERDGDCRWVVRKSDRFLLSELDDWIEYFTETEEYGRMKKSFSPAKMISIKNGIETPYDDIIKSNARILGWDWKLLASLISQESKFVLSTISPKGAMGLMQIKPSVAELYGVDDIFNPKDNIHAGTLFLSRLQGMYPPEHYDSLNALKFTLATYNCGEGRMRDCINYANYRGLDGRKWEDIVSIIPEMGEITDSSLNDIVKLGRFNGAETINFVEQILSRYEKYR